MAEKRVVVWIDGHRYALPYEESDPTGNLTAARVAQALQQRDAKPTELLVVPTAGVSGVSKVVLWVNPSAVATCSVLIEDYDEHDDSPNIW